MKGNGNGNGREVDPSHQYRECWCASQIFSLSAKVADAECDLPCDGDESQICGGSLRISVCVFLFFRLGRYKSVLKRSVEQVYDLQGDVDSVAAVGKSKSIRLVLELALVVGGAVFARLLW